MKKKLSLVTAAALLALGLPVSADAPTITITSPTAAAIVYSATFPFTQSIAFTVAHNENQGDPNAKDIRDVRNLEVRITQNGTTTTLANSLVSEPFKVGNTPACNFGAVAPYTNCTVPDTYTGTGAVNWTVPAPGTYGITVRAFHTGDLGEDVETVQFALLTAEYPAPPSVANAYIRSAYGKLPSKVNGCVISRIAEEHAKNETYGPKGGPYNTTLIQNDVASFIGLCQQ